MVAALAQGGHSPDPGGLFLDDQDGLLLGFSRTFDDAFSASSAANSLRVMERGQPLPLASQIQRGRTFAA
jgi:hypothetical protein